MEYQSGRASRPVRKGRKSTKIWIVVLILLILTACGLAVLHYPEKLQVIPDGWERIRNTFSFIILDQKPHFYALILEKNGKDYRLTSRDTVEISYRDEFVIKEISTDVLFGGGVAADIEGIGGKDDSRKLLKGIDLVDKAVLTGRNGAGENKPGGFSLRITYHGDAIAAIPIRLQI
ncbi:MAG: hypothetical protein NTW71_01735, partial [Deltaproteobacteria bacterium]|nr:hypothetical protein [Deltaproteobacteria bacterium]